MTGGGSKGRQLLLLLNSFIAELSPERTEIPGGGEKGKLHLTAHFQHYNDSGIEMGRGVSHQSYYFPMDGTELKSES